MKILSLFIVVSLLMATTQAKADISIIVHVDSPLKTISLKRVQKIYRGNVSRNAKGEYIVFSYQPDDNVTTKIFFKKVAGKPIAKLKKRWASKMFSGRMLAPIKLDNDLEVINWVSENKNGIGYIDSENLTSNVKPLLTNKDMLRAAATLSHC